MQTVQYLRISCLLDITDNNGEDFAEANQDGELSSDDDMEDIVRIISNAYYLSQCIMLCEMQSCMHTCTCRNAFWSFYYDSTVKIQISAQGADLVFWTWGRSAYWRRGSAYCIVM